MSQILGHPRWPTTPLAFCAGRQPARKWKKAERSNLTQRDKPLFFGTVPLVVAIIIITNDKRRLDRLLNLFTEVFAASAKGIIDALKIFRRRDNPPGIPSKEAGSSP